MFVGMRRVGCRKKETRQLRVEIVCNLLAAPGSPHTPRIPLLEKSSQFEIYHFVSQETFLETLLEGTQYTDQYDK